jgi:hypothetical protein
MSGSRISSAGPVETRTASDGQLTLSVPIRIKRRSGRKLVTLPKGEHARPWDLGPTPLQLALARGFRWLRMIESGEASSMSDIARREGGDHSYVARMLNLTTLAPDIIAAILDEAVPPEVRLVDLAISPPLLWSEQREQLGLAQLSVSAPPARSSRAAAAKS